MRGWVWELGRKRGQGRENRHALLLDRWYIVGYHEMWDPSCLQSIAMHHVLLMPPPSTYITPNSFKPHNRYFSDPHLVGVSWQQCHELAPPPFINHPFEAKVSQSLGLINVCPPTVGQVSVVDIFPM